MSRAIKRIITLGLNPCWDMTCRAEALAWGTHRRVAQQQRPAGKALNVSRALAWQTVKSVAAGLWGADDYQAMRLQLQPLRPWVSVAMTTVPGPTRQNITVIDTTRHRELHLRADSQMATKAAMMRLRRQLADLVRPADIVVMAGSAPSGPLNADVLSLVEDLHACGAQLVVDTSGPCLTNMVHNARLALIKPNVDEFRELIGRRTPDRAELLIKAAQPLLDDVATVLISRAQRGALLVRHDGAYLASCRQSRPVQTTVACGDYLLAGYLAGYARGHTPDRALKNAVRIATAHAWGLSENTSWPEAGTQIPVEVETL